MSNRKRLMVYSNAKKKKADKDSAFDDDLINLSEEVIIGMENPTDKKGKKNKVSNSAKQQAKPKKNNHNNGQANSNQKERAKVIQKNIQDKVRRQKIRIIKRITGVLLAVILLIGGLVYFMLSPVFNIKEIKVINNVGLTSESIINKSGIHIGDNLFKISKSNAKKTILQNPYIEEVNIKRKLCSTIEITVKEREATLMLDYGNSYVYINNQGYILEISQTKLDVPIITGYSTALDKVKPGNRLENDDLDKLNTVLSILDFARVNEFEDLITKIDMKSRKNYTMVLESEGKIVYLGSCSDLSTQMLFVKKNLTMEKGIEGEFYVDMDLNTNKPVFREKV